MSLEKILGKNNLLLHTTQHIFSGICICGHKAEIHHGNCIPHQKIIDATKSSTLFGECLRYGCNEGYKPCKKCKGWFIDKDDPFKEEKIKELSV